MRTILAIALIGLSLNGWAQEKLYQTMFTTQAGLGITAPNFISGLSNQQANLIPISTFNISAGIKGIINPKSQYGIQLGFTNLRLPLNVHYNNGSIKSAPDSVRYPIVSQYVLELPLNIRYSFKTESNRFWQIGLRPGYNVYGTIQSYINDSKTTKDVGDALKSTIISAEIGRGGYFAEGKKFWQVVLNYRFTNMFDNNLNYKPMQLSVMVGL